MREVLWSVWWWSIEYFLSSPLVRREGTYLNDLAVCVWVFWWGLNNKCFISIVVEWGTYITSKRTVCWHGAGISLYASHRGLSYRLNKIFNALLVHFRRHGDRHLGFTTEVRLTPWPVTAHRCRLVGIVGKCFYPEATSHLEKREMEEGETELPGGNTWWPTLRTGGTGGRLIISRSLSCACSMLCACCMYCSIRLKKVQMYPWLRTNINHINCVN